MYEFDSAPLLLINQSININPISCPTPPFLLCYFSFYSETHDKIATALELEVSKTSFFLPHFACTSMTLGWARDSSAIFAGILFLCNVPITICEFSWNAKYYIETRIYLLFSKQYFACGFYLFFQIFFSIFPLQTVSITLADVYLISHFIACCIRFESYLKHQ